MVLWQHPSNGTAAAFHDCLPDSDKLVDLMEDTTQTAWYFPLLKRALKTHGRAADSFEDTAKSACADRNTCIACISDLLTQKKGIFDTGWKTEWDKHFSLCFLTCAFPPFPHHTCCCNTVLYIAYRGYTRILSNDYLGQKQVPLIQHFVKKPFA